MYEIGWMNFRSAVMISLQGWNGFFGGEGVPICDIFRCHFPLVFPERQLSLVGLQGLTLFPRRIQLSLSSNNLRSTWNACGFRGSWDRCCPTEIETVFLFCPFEMFKFDCCWNFVSNFEVYKLTPTHLTQKPRQLCLPLFVFSLHQKSGLRSLQGNRQTWKHQLLAPY